MIPNAPGTGVRMSYVLGIDIGSGFSKAVVCEGGSVLASAVMPSVGSYRETARTVAEAALEKVRLSMADIALHRGLPAMVRARSISPMRPQRTSPVTPPVCTICFPG